MSVKIIKRVDVKATFPGGRVVTGCTDCLPQSTDTPFQIWLSSESGKSVIINPLMAETVELSVELEK